jgi:hypothetical protein
MEGEMFSLFPKEDPNQTIKHRSYREMRAEYKRQEQLFVKIWKAVFWMAMGLMLVMFIAENLVRLAP